MAARNRVENEGSTRAVLVGTTEQIMLEDGYAAVTYRSVAAKAGVALGTVQYHFPSLDDLFLAVVREYSERAIEKLTARMRAKPGDVLRILWELGSDDISTALMVELLALANHRKSIHAAIAEAWAQNRKAQLDALTEHSMSLSSPDGELTPTGLLFLLSCLPKWMLLEASLGIAEDGHAEVRRLAQRYLDRKSPLLKDQNVES